MGLQFKKVRFRMVTEEKLTKVMDYIRKFSEENGYTPSVREIAKECGIKSTATVHSYLEKLQDKGYVNKATNKKRSMTFGKSSGVSIPLIGTVTAGQPILAVEQIEDYIPYPTKDAEGLFALKVVGLSMRDAGILDGDIVIADKNAPCRSGDIIIGMDGDEATVKRLLIKGNQVIFMPENPDFLPIYPAKPEVLGKVVGVYRKY